MRAAQRTGRAAVVVVLTGCLGTGLLALPAAAADGSGRPPAVATNWYWTQASPSVEGNTLPVGAPAPASGVQDGALGVGYTTDVDKVAAVAFDLGAVPLGSTFNRFRVTVPLAPGATQLASGHPDVSACEAIDAFADGTGPTDYAKAPPVSLPSCVKGTFSDAVAGYVFDLTAVANDWSGGAPAYGIVLRPTPGAATPQPFTLSLAGKNGITTDAAWTTPPAVPDTVAPPASTPEAPVAAPPPVLPGVVAPPPPLGGVTAPPPLTAPEAPAPQVGAVPAPVVPLTRAASVTPGSLVPSTGWWLAFLGALGLLGLTSLSLGDPMAPVPVDSRRRRFAEVVRVHAATSGAATARAVPARPAPSRTRTA